MSTQEELKAAFVAGYRACLFDYAVHKKDELLVGVRQRPLKKVSEEVPDDVMVRAAFQGFLNKTMKR